MRQLLLGGTAIITIYCEAESEDEEDGYEEGDNESNCQKAGGNEVGAKMTMEEIENQEVCEPTHHSNPERYARRNLQRHREPNLSDPQILGLLPQCLLRPCIQ